ncbi:hypothetical protein ACFPTO_22795 [Paraburkholderia denitrificans]|uniref:Uncharacterized protein n=1 Tax=Paraburkholderia denitrificans TaxID=694025 RepID=A0ABW0JF03_9BURK
MRELEVLQEPAGWRRGAAVVAVVGAACAIAARAVPRTLRARDHDGDNDAEMRAPNAGGR